MPSTARFPQRTSDRSRRRAVFLKIKNLLSAAEVGRLSELAAELRFVDGRVSNPANVTKENLQADPRDAKYAESVQVLQAALVRSREFVDFAMPKRIAPPLLCRYEPGMKYGAHADAAIIQVSAARLRSDLSCTIFVGDPSSYEGGELAIVAGNQTVAFKGLPARRSSTPRRCCTRSCRYARASAWLQSRLSRASSRTSTSVCRCTS